VIDFVEPGNSDKSDRRQTRGIIRQNRGQVNSHKVTAHRLDRISRHPITLASEPFAVCWSVWAEIFSSFRGFFWVRVHRRRRYRVKRGQLGGTFVDGNES